MTRTLTLAIVALLLGSLPAQAAPAEEPQESGKQLYQKYCASCHGVDGHGETPLAKLFETKPPDLTRLSPRGDSWFPDGMIRELVDGRLVAHGRRDMPVWGEVLTPAQIAQIAEYLSSIQDHTLSAP